MDSNKKTICWIVSLAAIFLVIATFAQSCAQEPKRSHLGHFARVNGVSISSDGNHLTFDGCGHKDFPGCTMYRYDRNKNILYRYVHENPSLQIMGAVYWSESPEFLFFMVPKTPGGKQVFDEAQIGIMRPDGTGSRQLTEGKGLKVAYMLSPDGKTLVYARGKERTEGKTPASYFDYYALNLATGKETRLTNLCFYEAGSPYFTPDGKHIVFNNGSPMEVPGSNDSHAGEKFRDAYKEKYSGNLIISYPVDGSGVNRLPEPWFVHGTGADNPIITRDGSLFFRGTSHGDEHYRRYPDGKITNYTYEELGLGKTRYPFDMAVDFTGTWMAILYQSLESRVRSVGVFNTSTRTCTPISVPETATNITVR